VATRRVNLRKEKCDIKITRTKDHQVPDPPLDGCLGNPFPVGKFGLKACLEMFRNYFRKRIETDPVYRDYVLAQKGKRLGCFCEEGNPCHGDIYVEYLETAEVKV
jgi:hypothetical protein